MIKKLKNSFKDMDKTLLMVSLLLFVFGLLNIVNASSKAVVVRYNTSLYGYFYKQALFLIIGFILTLIIITVPTKKYHAYGAFCYIGITVALIYLSLYGTVQKGSYNWINFGIFSFQPSEFSKPIMIVCVSLLFEKFLSKLRNKKINHYDFIGIILFVGCLFPIIVFLQKDLGTTIILFLIFVVLFMSSPILRIDKLRTVVLGIILIIIACIIVISKNGSILTKTQLSRFDFFDPCSDYEAGGYQICNGFIAINDGGLLGVGIGKSKQISYIPESHTDSVFAIIAEEYGFLVSSVIFICYIIILYRILKISANANTVRGRYISLGVAVYIFLHVLVNLGGLFGVMPLTGVPLPFLSYGGSFTIALICSLAIVQRIHIETKNKKIKV